MARGKFLGQIKGLFGITVLTLAIGFAFTGCNFTFDDNAPDNTSESKYIPVRERVSVDKLESSFSKTVWHMTNAIDMTVEAIDNYIDISEIEGARSAKGGQIDLLALADYLPKDLTTLKRQVSKTGIQGRTALDTDSPEDTITLQDELTEILDYVNTTVEQIIPSLDFNDLPEDVFVDCGYIHLPGGGTVPQHSLEGIATVEVLNAAANGENIEAAAQRITAEIASFMEESAIGEGRGLFVNPVQRWSGGTVRYYINPNFRSNYKMAMRNAMNDWETASGGKVKFIEVDLNFYNNPLLTIVAATGFVPVVKISEKVLGKDIAGKAAPGVMPIGLNYLYIDPSVPNGEREDPNKQNAYSVSLHELGHVLGLQHEHQRADRDDYIRVTETDSNYKKIPEVVLTTISGIRLVWKSTKILFVTIWYPVIVIDYNYNNQFQKTSFDFLSIMMYSGLEIKHSSYKNAAYGDKYGTIWRTKYTSCLSDSDKAFIKKLY